MLADFCAWVFKFKTFLGAFIPHLAALVQKKIAKFEGTKVFLEHLTVVLKKQFDNDEK